MKRLSVVLVFVLMCWGCTGAEEYTDLTFDFSDAQGIAKSLAVDLTPQEIETRVELEESGETEDFFKKVNENGELKEFYTGKLDIKETFISPNNDVYLLLYKKAKIRTPSGEEIECVFLKVTPRDNVYECVDEELATIITPCYFEQDEYVKGYCSDPVQFDSSGAVYYVGEDDAGFTVFRKATLSDSVSADTVRHVVKVETILHEDALAKSLGIKVPAGLITLHMQLFGYLVMPDGTIYFYGRTKDTGWYWLRKLSPAGVLDELEGTNTAVEWMGLAPDNNIYVGSTLFDVPGFAGVFIIDPLVGAIEDKCWIEVGDDYLLEENKCDPLNPLGFQAPYYKESTLCATYGLGDGCLENVFVKEFVQTYSGDVYANVGWLSGNLWKFYPTVEYVDLSSLSSAIVNISVIEGWPNRNYLVIAGTNYQNEHKFILYRTFTGVEYNILPAGMEIEIYGMSFTGPILWFHGHRFNDNKYVIGKALIIAPWPSISPAKSNGDEVTIDTQILNTISVPLTGLKMFYDEDE